MILSKILKHLRKVLGHTHDEVPYNIGRKDTSIPRVSRESTTTFQCLGSTHHMARRLRSMVDILGLILLGEISQVSINPDIGQLRFLDQELQQNTTRHNLIQQHMFQLHTAQKRPT